MSALNKFVILSIAVMFAASPARAASDIGLKAPLDEHKSADVAEPSVAQDKEVKKKAPVTRKKGHKAANAQKGTTAEKAGALPPTIPEVVPDEEPKDGTTTTD